MFFQMEDTLNERVHRKRATGSRATQEEST